MKASKLLIIGSTLILAMTIVACQNTVPTPANEMDSLFTQAALTVQAMQTQEPTATVPPVVPTVTATPTLTLPSPTPTNTPPPTAISQCDWVAFVKDVTIPDGTVIEQNKTFNKTWRLKNRGTCTWTTSYSLVFSSGSLMDGPINMALPQNVNPEETIDISVTLKAPDKLGSYRGYWMLKNASGVLFGIGDTANKAFFVDIRSGSGTYVGLVSGKICFPSEHIPPMTLFLQRLKDDDVTLVSIKENQTSYTAQLEPGKYKVYAWLDGYALGGAYTYSDQNDHRLKPFMITSNVETSKIDICDWYGGPGSVPFPPYMSGGRISGTLSYPSEFIPPLRVVAFNLTTHRFVWVDTQRDQATYQISNLTPGTYHVVAYFREAGAAGGYSIARNCDLSSPCADHALIPIEVKVNSHITGVDPADWYAPIGTFPPDPTTSTMQN